MQNQLREVVCSIKTMFLKFSQNSQENAGVGFSFLIKLIKLIKSLFKKWDSNTVIFLWKLWKIFLTEYLHTTTFEQLIVLANVNWSEGEVYLWPCQTSMMDLFAKINNV